MSAESHAPTHRQLSLVRSDRVNVSVARSKEVQQPVPFLEPVIDGVPLRALVRAAGYGDDFVTMLCPLWQASSIQSTVQRLLHGNHVGGEPVDMLVCPVCADRDCGAVLADVTVADDEVVWSNWRWTDYDPAGGMNLPLPTMRFLRGPYERLLASATASVAALPYDEVPSPRTFWPWQWGWGFRAPNARYRPDLALRATRPVRRMASCRGGVAGAARLLHGRQEKACPLSGRTARGFVRASTAPGTASGRGSQPPACPG